MDSKTNVAVLVSGGGTNLQSLLDAETGGRLPHADIALVISNVRDAFALERAKKAGVPTAVVIKKELGSQEAFEQRILDLITVHDIDLIVLAGFMTILSADFVSRFPERIINVHPALLPSFCGKGFYGLKVHEAALQRGVKVTGATVHFVNEIPDGGKIISQKAVEVRDGDTPETLQKRVMEEAEWVLLPEAVEMVAEKLYNEYYHIGDEA